MALQKWIPISDVTTMRGKAWVIGTSICTAGSGTSINLGKKSTKISFAPNGESHHKRVKIQNGWAARLNHGDSPIIGRSLAWCQVQHNRQKYRCLPPTLAGAAT